MSVLKDLLYAFWQQNFEIFSDFNLSFCVYLFVFVILFLENGLLFAAFLPGDSLLFFIGVLIAKGVLSFPITLGVLTVAVSLGSWISYLQGRLLGNTRLGNNCWFAKFSKYYHHRACLMFRRHGLSALIIGRFVAFIRTLLPIVIAFSGLDSVRFHFFSCISAFLWVFIIVLLGFILGNTAFFQFHEQKLMCCLMLLPIMLLTVGLVFYISAFLFKK
ncbi:DedA family protein [Blochmannia endosymbiont of Colobopsis nipponica]|uniref:DedA family protein n=1 Tax=Blochmannia endosymbiont of Colobopsis nipponica TaxID=2681987 RepID=UPI0017851B75|nr:DedA family protein [Blochmannia endosymbiont of Colobopsis nipponica]QOI10794.1 DedA family protein [Blochmannia endosymbiont of Colobopsis nipponica]